jgi:phosphatidate cytidylyltransferase
MLKARILTAVALLMVLLPALFRAPQWLWVAVGLLVVAVAAWEWGRLLKASASHQKGFAVFFVLLCLVLGLLDPASIGMGDSRDNPYATLHGGQFNTPLYGVAVIFWCAVVPLWLYYKWQLRASLLGWLVGVVVLLPAWVALVHLRAVDVPLLLAVLSVAWVADVAAYFTGRRFGKHKLAPSISPGKTWEGAAGALVGILLFGGVLATTLVYELDRMQLVLALCLITAISIIGDLFESLLKRQAGIKDSSNILPGHGGVLDRIDSLTSTLPIAAVLLLWFFP